MCLDCGCMQPDNDHGDARHITAERFQQAVQANDTDAEQVKNNIIETTHRIQEGELQTEASGFER